MKVLVTLVLFSFFLTDSFGQAPIINTVQPLTSYPGNAVLITGSGFSSTKSQLAIWFDQVKVNQASILSASEFSIEVLVPPQARLSNIEVINLSTGLSGKTLSKYVPFYSGVDFLATEFTDPVAGSTTFPTGTEESFDVCSCDLDGDGKPDLASTKNGAASTTISILKNTSTPGNMSFASSTGTIGAPSINLACGDLNMDGKPDLVIVRGGVTRNQIFVMRNTSTVGSITFAAPTSYFIDPLQSAFRVVIRDLNLDGKPEVIVSNSNNIANANLIYIFTNQSSAGTLTLNATPTKVVVTGASTTYGLDAQDIDGDKKPDLILSQFNAGDIFILKNESSVGQVSFPNTTKIPLPGNLNHLTTADFNEDGKLDIAVTSSANDNKAFVLLNQSASGSISFSTLPTLTGGDWPFGIDASDIDGDQDVDIVIGNINNNNVLNEIIVYRSNGDNANLSFTRETIQKGKKSRNLRVGDLDGDGKPDIAYTTVTGNSIDILRNKNCFVPVITNPAPVTICVGQTIKLNSIPNLGVASFAWKESANAAFKTSTDPFADITAVGSYTVTATSEAGTCVKVSAAVSVGSSLGTIPPDPTINTIAPVCSGQTIQLSTPTVAGVTYIWTGPNSFSSTDQNPSRANVTAADAGVYSLRLQVDGGTCKTNAATKVADVVNMANFFVSSSVASNAICEGSSLNLLVNGAAGHTYQWIKDGADISGQTAGTLAVTQAGVYKIRVTNTALGCSAETNAVTVIILTMPVSQFTASATSICVNQPITFTDQSTFDSRATPTYNWDFGDGTNSTVKNPPPKTYTAAATRAVQLTVGYSGVTGCTNASTKSIIVAAPQLPVISATINPICPAEESSVLSVTGTFTTYAWTGPVTGSTATLSIDKPGTYVVNTVEANGCTGTDDIVITEKPKVLLTVTADGDPVVSGEDVLVFAGIPVQLLAAGADTYSWSPLDGLDNASIANPLATPLTETDYTVTGSKAASCDGEFIVSIKFDPAGNVFQPPNVFSPNGDATNDMWVIAGVQNYLDCTLAVFNKQGGKVFEQKGYTNTWDGTYDGKQLPEGTYYYVLNCPDKKPATGNVLIAR